MLQFMLCQKKKMLPFPMEISERDDLDSINGNLRPGAEALATNGRLLGDPAAEGPPGCPVDSDSGGGCCCRCTGHGRRGR